jgi:hypothetical protein
MQTQPTIREPRDINFTGPACPRCLMLSMGEDVWPEMVMPLPPGAEAPLARDGSGPCCHDCAAADSLWDIVLPGKYAHLSERRATRERDTWFAMARIAVGNDRMEQMRLPGAPMGLVWFGLTAPSKPGDLHAHAQWLESLGYFTRDDDA